MTTTIKRTRSLLMLLALTAMACRLGARPEARPTTAAAAPAAPEGYALHEVSTLAPFGADATQTWYAAHLRYWVPRGVGVSGRRADSMHLRLTGAPTAAGPVRAGRVTVPPGAVRRLR